MKNTLRNTMKKVTGILLVIMTLVLAVAPVLSYAEEPGTPKTAYVNCTKGRKLNLRQEPNGKIICRLKNGTEVTVTEYVQNDWAKVVLKNGKTGYVMSKFLRDRAPGKYEVTEAEENFQEVKAHYIVTAKALNKNTQKSVGLREAPNKTANAIRTLYKGDELEVIARGRNWLKVIDLLTGKTGYVAKGYVK